MPIAAQLFARTIIPGGQLSFAGAWPLIGNSRSIAHRILLQMARVLSLATAQAGAIRRRIYLAFYCSETSSDQAATD